jgi:hypothetical protein
MSNLSTHAKDATCSMRLCGMRMVTLLSPYSRIGFIKSLPIDTFAAGAHYITTPSRCFLVTETDASMIFRRGSDFDPALLNLPVRFRAWHYLRSCLHLSLLYVSAAI